MTTKDILSLTLIFITIILSIYKLEKRHDEKLKNHEKAQLELYDRITDLEQQVDELKDNSITTGKKQVNPKL